MCWQLYWGHWTGACKDISRKLKTHIFTWEVLFYILMCFFVLLKTQTVIICEGTHTAKFFWLIMTFVIWFLVKLFVDKFGKLVGIIEVSISAQTTWYYWKVLTLSKSGTFIYLALFWNQNFTAECFCNNFVDPVLISISFGWNML